MPLLLKIFQSDLDEKRNTICGQYMYNNHFKSNTKISVLFQKLTVGILRKLRVSKRLKNNEKMNIKATNKSICHITHINNIE